MLIVGPTLSTNATYRADTYLARISMVGRTNMVLVVSAEEGPKTLGELVAKLGKDHLTFASAGAGTMRHLSSEFLLLAVKAKAGHVAVVAMRVRIDQTGHLRAPAARDHGGIGGTGSSSRGRAMLWTVVHYLEYLPVRGKLSDITHIS